MKNLLKLFCILDLISIIRLLTSKQLTNFGDGDFIWITVFSLLLGLSLVFTAYFSIRNKIAGIWIYYAQFIPRLIFSFGLSFGFILVIFDYFKVKPIEYNTMIIVLSLFEAIRLIITILIHKKIRSKTKNTGL